MDSGRQTRRRSYPQSTSLQPGRNPKDKASVEKSAGPASPSASSETSNDKKPQTTKAKATKPEKMQIETQSTQPSSSEPNGQNQQSQKPTHNLASNEESTNKAASTQKRVSPVSTHSGEPVDENKKQIEMLYEIAQASASKGDYNQAINIYTKIVKHSPHSTPAYIAIGHCYAVLGENFKALNSYQQALSIAPDSQKDDQLWYGIGLLYQKIEDWKNAETSFRNALRLNPSPTIKGELLYNLGLIMKNLGDPKESTRMLMNSILLGSFSIDKMVEVLCTVGQAQEETGEVAEAMKTYKHALTLDENNLRALECAGWLSFQLDKIAEALEYLTKASLINEDDSNITYMKARCYLKLKQHSKAYDNLHACITVDSSNSMYWCSLGILFAEMNQLKSAHECFSNALKFNPKNPENYFNMGCLYELCFQLEDALAMHSKAIEIQPNFQLAIARRLGVYGQIESKDNSLLEVQFKHHKFILSIDKQSKAKPVFSFPQLTQDALNLESQHESNTAPRNSTTNSSAAQAKPTNILSGLSQTLKASSLIENSVRDSSSLKASKPTHNETENKTAQNAVVKPQEKEHGPKNQGVSLGLNLSLPALKGKEDETPNGVSRLEGLSTKSSKGVFCPVLVKADPLALQQRDDQGQKIEGLSGVKSQTVKTGFKLAHKVNRDEDEDHTVQKKLKVDAISAVKSGSTSPLGAPKTDIKNA